MFAVSMCFVFILLLLCVLLPSWVSKLSQRRRRRELNDRMNNVDGLIDNPDMMQEGLLG